MVFFFLCGCVVQFQVIGYFVVDGFEDDNVFVVFQFDVLFVWFDQFGDEDDGGRWCSCSEIDVGYYGYVYEIDCQQVGGCDCCCWWGDEEDFGQGQYCDLLYCDG